MADLRDWDAMLRRLREADEAEKRGRAEWIAGIKQRWRVVCLGDAIDLSEDARRQRTSP